MSSRGWAALGAVSGLGVGAVVGSVVGARLRGPDSDMSELEAMNAGGLLGMIIGTGAGAAIGAGGGGPPKQIGTAGVGADLHLPANAGFP